MTARFSGRTVLVTGASRGIGRAIAAAFGAEGAWVAVGCRTHVDEAESTLTAIRGTGGDGRVTRFDVRDRAEVDAAVATVAAERGAFDVVVNAAGIADDALFAVASPGSWGDVIRTDLDGVFHVCQAVLRPMLGRRRGAIVNVASIAALRASPGQAAYASAKAGVVALTRTLAAEVAGRNVRVNAVLPGLIATGIAARLSPEVARQKTERIPLGRFGEADEVARVVLFLASDDASYLIGQAIAVDGGLSA